MSTREDINRIRERAARSYDDLPKYQQLNSALADVRKLLAEVERLEGWTEGLQATALKWASESIDLRSEIARLSMSVAKDAPADGRNEGGTPEQL